MSSGDILLDCIRVWRKTDFRGGTVYQTGDWPNLESVISEGSAGDIAILGDILCRGPRGLGAMVIQTRHHILGIVDHCRSQPIFYCRTSSGWLVGSDAEAIRARAGLTESDAISALEAKTAGYATGSHTLYKGLHQIPAGALVRCRPESTVAETQQTYGYRPKPVVRTAEALSAELGGVIDRLFADLMRRFADRPIWVPLSGGLDSRLVLGKLVEAGHRNLHAFSYGPRNNSDARRAQAIAQRLNIPWTFVDTPGSAARAYFDSARRRQYWRYAANCCVVPNNQDILPLSIMLERGLLPRDAVVINGQTGDFISGGHVPPDLVKPGATVGLLLGKIIDKHYGLWPKILDETALGLIKRRIRSVLGIDQPEGAVIGDAAAAAFEQWEYAERQSKYIVNGQRIYDFLGLEWDLPLWNFDFVDFWRCVPYDLKVDQRLYRQYLSKWNYCGLFSDFDRNSLAWSPGLSVWLVPLSVATRFVLGRRRRDMLMRYVRYYERFGDHYRMFGFAHFARHAQEIRSPVSLYAKTWLVEAGLWSGS